MNTLLNSSFFLNLLFRGIVFAISFLTVLYVFRISELNEFQTDFGAYYRGAKRFLAHDFENIYNLQLDGQGPFRYLPQTIFLFLPFALGSFFTGNLMWFCFQVISILIGFYFIFLQFKKKYSVENSKLLLSFFFLIHIKFYLEALHSGNIVGPIFLGISIIYCYQSVVFANFLGLLKVGPFIFLWPHFLKGYSKTVLITLFFLSSLTLLLYVFVQNIDVIFALFQSWMHVVLEDGNYVDHRFYKVQSLNGVLSRWSNNDLVVKQAGLIFSLFLIGVFIIYSFQKKSLFRENIVHSLGFYLLCMPETYKHTLFLSTFFYFHLWLKKESSKRVKQFFLILGCIQLLIARDILGPNLEVFVYQLSIPFFIFIALWISLFCFDSKN